MGPGVLHGLGLGSARQLTVRARGQRGLQPVIGLPQCGRRGSGASSQRQWPTVNQSLGSAPSAADPAPRPKRWAPGPGGGGVPAGHALLAADADAEPADLGEGVVVADDGTDPRLADGRAVSDIFDEGWAPILASIHRQIDHWQTADETLGPETVLRPLTLHGFRTESVGGWWGSGWYESTARRAVARAAGNGGLPTAFPDTERLADTAACHPDLLDDDTFSWLTEAVFEEESLRRDALLPVPAAVTLPDWAAQDLPDLLQPDIDEEEPDRTHTSGSEAADEQLGMKA